MIDHIEKLLDTSIVIVLIIIALTTFFSQHGQLEKLLDQTVFKEEIIQIDGQVKSNLYVSGHEIWVMLLTVEELDVVIMINGITMDYKDTIEKSVLTGLLQLDAYYKPYYMKDKKGHCIAIHYTLV
jgi:hypothetical protein